MCANVLCYELMTFSFLGRIPVLAVFYTFREAPYMQRYRIIISCYCYYLLAVTIQNNIVTTFNDVGTSNTYSASVHHQQSSQLSILLQRYVMIILQIHQYTTMHTTVVVEVLAILMGVAQLFMY